MRADPRPRPDTLTIEPDGQTLEGIIGDLQSEMGIPQYPQEYRITIKVAEEGGRGATIQETVQDPPDEGGDGGPKREKAPAAPRIAGGIARALSGAAETNGGGGGGRRRRKRRRGRGGRGRGGSGGSGGGAPRAPGA